MKRLVLLAALLILCMAPGLDSTAYKCVLTNTCNPLPCEFMYALKLAKATVHAIGQAPASKSMDPKAVRRFVKGYSDELDKTARKYSRCAPYTPPRLVVVVGSKPACEIGVSEGQQPTSLADELSAGRTCSELVEAGYARAEAERTFCQIFGAPRDLRVWKAQLLLEEQARVDSLESNLLRYLSSCAPDANTSRQIAEAGLDALARSGQEAREKWEAKRAIAAGGAK